MGFGNWVKGRAKQAVRLADKVPGSHAYTSAVARTVGSAIPAIGPAQQVRDQFFTTAKNVADPRMSVMGRANPAPAPQLPAFVAGRAPAGGGGGGGNVLGDMTGAGIYDGGAGGAYDEDLDPNRIAQVRGEIGGLTGTFDQYIQEALGMVDRLAAEKKQALLDNYGGQRANLQETFSKGSQQINDIYSARGAYNSSYRDDEQGAAKNAFESAMGGLDKSQEQDLGEIGQFVEGQKASLNAGRPNYNLNDYTTVSDLLDVKSMVDEAVRSLGETKAGLGTNSDYTSKLNAVAPDQEQGSSAIKAQLDRLASTNAPSDTKRVIATAAIQAAGEDPNQWEDYFDRLLQSQGSQAAPASAGGGLGLA